MNIIYQRIQVLFIPGRAVETFSLPKWVASPIANYIDSPRRIFFQASQNIFNPVEFQIVAPGAQFIGLWNWLENEVHMVWHDDPCKNDAIPFMKIHDSVLDNLEFASCVQIFGFWMKA